MLENPLSSGVIGVFLTLFIGLLLFGVGLLKPAAWTAKPCFILAAIVLFGWSSWVIVILPIQAPFIILIGLIFLIFVLIGVGLIELLRWVDSNKVSEKIIVQAPLIKLAHLVMRSLLIKDTYAFGTILGGIKWSSEFRDLRVIFENLTDDDYQDLDFTIRPDFPDITIAAIGQISNIPNVTFFNPVMQAYLRPNGTPDVKFDRTTGHTQGDTFKVVAQGKGFTPLRVYPNYYRIRCDKLPHHMILEITLAVHKKDIEKQNGKIHKVWLKGQYYGGSIIRSIDQTISVSN